MDTLFKYHAACYLTHSSIEAIKLLRRQLSFSGPDLASIDIHVAPVLLGDGIRLYDAPGGELVHLLRDGAEPSRAFDLRYRPAEPRRA